jgi:diketogulonate reductase-like aldo/keto reductase
MVRINKNSRPLNQRGNRLFNLILIGLFLIMAGTLSTYFVLTKQAKLASMFAEAHSSSHLLSHSKPFLMYGTAWKKENTARYVMEAIQAGFRFIDTACQPKHYNEPGVGAGWKAAAAELGLRREDLFLQTKFTDLGGQDPKNLPYDADAPIEEQVRTSLAVSLKNLQTDYLDSLVMHGPRDTVEETMEVWRVMETFVDEGKVKRLGMSNCYDYKKFTTIYEMARIKPWVLQNRFYAQSNFDTDLRRFLKENGVWYQSFWTLTASRKALAKPEVQELAEEKGLTPQTYMFAFLMSLGLTSPLSGTTSRIHMAEDVAVMERIQAGEVFFENEEQLRHMAQLLEMPDL